MKMSSLLLLATCGLAPLQAQDAPAASSPAAMLREMLAPALPAAPVSLQQRAAAIPALAQIAASDYVAVAHIDSILQYGVDKGFISDASLVAQNPVKSMALAGDLKQFLPLYEALMNASNMQSLAQLTEMWEGGANMEYAGGIATLTKEFSKASNLLEVTEGAVSQMEPTIYLAVELKPQLAGMAVALLPQIDAQAANLPEGVTMERRDASVSIKIPGEVVNKLLLENPETAEQLLWFSNGFKDKCFYLNVELKGSLLNLSLSTNPESVRWAASPEQSVLAQEGAAYLDEKLAQGGFFFSSVSKDSMNAFMQSANASSIYQLTSVVFSSLGDVLPSARPAFAAAASAAISLNEAYFAIAPTYQSDTTITMCLDDDLNVEMKTLSFGGFQKAPMRMSDALIRPDTMLYMEMSPYCFSACNTEQLEGIPSSLAKITQAVSLTLNEEVAPTWAMASLALEAVGTGGNDLPAEMQPLYQIGEQCWEMGMQLCDGLGSSGGYLIGSQPDALGVLPFAVFAGVRDRAAVTEASAGLFAMAEMFSDGTVSSSFFDVTEKGATTQVGLESVNLPYALNLGDALLTLSSGADMQKSVETSPLSEQAGFAFVWQTAPSLKLLGGLEGQSPEMALFFQSVDGVYATVTTQGAEDCYRLKLDMK